MHLALVNRLGGLSLSRNSVVKLTDRPNMTIAAYNNNITPLAGDQWWPFFVTFLFPVTDILCLVIQYVGKIN